MEGKQIRIVFMGTPDFAVGPLGALVDGGYNIVGVVTMPDKPAGRGQKLQESAVKQYAVSKGLHIMQPEKLKDPAFVEEFRSLNADLGIVIAFRMLPEIIWSAPRLGTINLHASLLPQYRGAAPINRAIINGETLTGVTTFFLQHEIDTGDIVGQQQVVIEREDTAGTLHDKLMAAGTDLVLDTIDRIAAGNAAPFPQPVTDIIKTAPKIFKEDREVDWTCTPKEIYDHVRGLSPYPTAWATMRKLSNEGEADAPAIADDSINVKIYSCEELTGSGLPPGTITTDGRTYLHVACFEGAIRIDELQLSGKKRMPVGDFLRGFKEIAEYKFV